MTITEWFDPYNKDHVRAYRHLEKNGAWPVGFVPDDVTVRGDGLWNLELVGKMAQAWLTAVEQDLV